MAIAAKKSDQAPRRAGIYGRISDDREGRGQGVERQEVDGRALAKKRGWVVADVYVDNDISAFSGKRRPQYRRLLEDIKAGAIDGVIAWHPDRLHRSPVELEEFIDTIEAVSIPVLTVQGGEYDLSTASGRMTARVVGAVARHESEHKSERIKRKHAQLAQQGRIPGGGRDRPFGYEVDRMTIRTAEATLIRDGVKRLLAGQSLRSIAVRWNASGVKTSGGHAWLPSAARVVLNSARIAGLREHEGTFYPGVWPAIVARGDWERVRAVLSDPSRLTARGARKYLLAGLLRCGRCDEKLVARPRAAECVRWTESRSELTALRRELAALRAKIRVIVEAALQKKATPAAARQLGVMRKQEQQLRAREIKLSNVKRHLPIPQRQMARAGKPTARTCVTCGSGVASTRTYVCATGPGFGGCGKIRRLADPVETLIGQLVIHRVDGPALQKALLDQERDASKAQPAKGDIAALERQLDSLAVDHAKKRISRREWLAARDVVQQELDTLQVSIRREQRTTALAPFRDGRGVLAKRWPTLSGDERRAIIKVVIDKVVVRPALKGRNLFDPSLIEPVWRL